MYGKGLITKTKRGMKNLAIFVVLAFAVLAEPKVTVKALVESYCPDCIYFTANDLLQLTQIEEMMAITDLEIVPYGKAHIVSRDPPAFTCQHGEKECYGNKVELCSLAYYPKNGLNMMNCMQKYRAFDDDTIAECAKMEQVDAAPIIDCAKGVEGNNLMLYAGDLTPTLSYVPSIIVNGELHSDVENIIQYICDAYTGEKPSVCKTSLRH